MSIDISEKQRDAELRFLDLQNYIDQEGVHGTDGQGNATQPLFVRAEALFGRAPSLRLIDDTNPDYACYKRSEVQIHIGRLKIEKWITYHRTLECLGLDLSKPIYPEQIQNACQRSIGYLVISARDFSKLLKSTKAKSIPAKDDLFGTKWDIRFEHDLPKNSPRERRKTETWKEAEVLTCKANGKQNMQIYFLIGDIK